MMERRQSFFRNWGRFVHRYRWIVVVLSAMILIGMGNYARQLPETLKENGFAPRGSESDIGFTYLQDKLDYPASAITVVYSSRTMDLTSGPQVSAILFSLSDVQKLPYVRSVKVNTTPRLKANKGVQSVQISLALSKTEALNRYPELRAKIRPLSEIDVYVDGATATTYDVQQATKHDLAKSEKLGLPIALIVLLLIFGSFMAAILPLIIGVMSVAVTLGLCFFINKVYTLSNFTPNMVTMVGLAVGIDYALFVVSRFREELVKEPDVSAAVAATCHRAGKSIFFSGFAVLIGMLGLLFINLPVMRSLCIGGVLVVLTSVLFSNTMLLALLGIFGHKINRLVVFPALQSRRQNSTAWERIAFSVMKRPVFLVLLISGILILLMLPIGGMKLGVPTAEVLPPSYESRQGSDILKTTYDSREANPIQIIVNTRDEVWKEGSIREIQNYTSKIRTYDGVAKVRSLITVLGNRPPGMTAVLLQSGDTKRRIEEMKLAKGHTALIVVVPESDPESNATAGLVHRIREADTAGLQSYVTGMAANRVDILDRIDRGMPAMAGFVMAVTYLVLFVAFESILLPLKAVLMNILSLGASLGIVVIIFQKGMLADVLHITSVGYVSIVLPVTIFCVVFGVSMDYEVFLISRIKEEYEKTGDNERSTAAGLMQTGGLITSAALILIVVVGSFVFTDIEITKALGVGLFSAVFIDATFIRVIVVPALMKLLGRANWWAPAWVR